MTKTENLNHFGRVKTNCLCAEVVVSNTTECSFTLETGSDRSKNGANHPARRHPFDCRPFTREEVSQPKYWAKVDKDGPVPALCPELGPCWLWTASKNKRGYGSFSVNGRLILAHRVACVLDGVEIPAGKLIDHQCRNSSCVNPAHLRPATCSQNNLNTERSQRDCCPHGHPRAENLFFKRGTKQCRACHTEYQRKWRAGTRSANSTKRAKQDAVRQARGFAWTEARP